MIDIKTFIKTYKQERIILKNLQFTEGITILKGSNGSGKSTILKALSGLITSNITPYNAAYMPERPIFPPYMDAYTYLWCVQSMIKNPCSNPDRLLKKFNLPLGKEKRIKDFSKGMKQKLALCELLMEKQPVYLLDEPFNGLDKASLTLAIKTIEALKGIIIISLHETVKFKKSIKEIRL